MRSTLPDPFGRPGFLSWLLRTSFTRLVLHPKSAMSRIRLGTLVYRGMKAEKQGKDEKAIRCLNKLLEGGKLQNEPEFHAMIYECKARSCERLGLEAEATQARKSARELKGQAK